MNNFESFLRQKNITKTRAAKEIGISRQWLYAALNGQPIGKRAAQKIEKWSGGFVTAVELMQL
jgi:DNA-binding XRE family transcriptional regulator